MIEVQERDKYRRMWAHPTYGAFSPGLAHVKDLFRDCDPHPGESVVDLGCGDGSAGVELARRGLAVTLVDLCPTALRPALDLPFVDTCLSRLLEAGVGVHDWIYSVDVLEHLHPDVVDTALDQMAAVTGKGGLLRISTELDGCGALIGERLHLSVHPHEWWFKQAAARWQVRKAEVQPHHAAIVVGPPLV